MATHDINTQMTPQQALEEMKKIIPDIPVIPVMPSTK
jgi:hypothetical protein